MQRMATPKKKHPKKGGRPTKYKPEYNVQAYKCCLLGATNDDLAMFFDVNVDSIKEWMKHYPTFSAAIKEGRKSADNNVAQSLYRRAIGYSHKEDVIMQYQGSPVIVPTTKKYPPDVTAAIFWLKNRQPAKWRDKQDVEHSGNVQVRQTMIIGGKEIEL